MQGFCLFLSKRKIIKKGWKILLVPLTLLFLLLSALYLAIHTQGVQTFLTHKLTSYLSKKLDADIHLGSVDIALFNKLVLHDVWIEDQQGDTLVWAGKISAKLNSLILSDKFAGIGRLTIDNSRFFISKNSDGVFNFSFLLNTREKDTLSQNEWKFACNTFRLKNSEFVYRDRKKGNTEYKVDDINLRIDGFKMYPDTLLMKVSSFTLIDSQGFYLNNLTADISSTDGKFSLKNLTFETLHSRVDSAEFTFEHKELPGGGGKRLAMELQMNEARLNLADLALFVPSFRGMNQELEISGLLTGNFQNFKARDLVIRTGDNTMIGCDLSIDLFGDMHEPFIFLDINQLSSNFRDLSSIRLPNSAKFRYLSFPADLLESGTFTYQGNFTGFLTDFVAYGTLISPMGLIKTDISFVPVSGNNIRYKGRLKTEGFRLGEFLNSTTLGDLSFNGMVDGLYNKTRKRINGNFNGAVSSLAVNHYTYKNILLDGNLDNRKFEGNVKIDDPGLKLNFSGKLNLDDKVPAFDFIMNLDKADLVALHLDTLQSASNLEFEMAANFTGSNLDNMEGLIQVFNGKYSNHNDTMAFDNLTVNTRLDETISQINLTSDYFDLSVVGTYHFNNLLESFRIVLARYLPALGVPRVENVNTNQFAFDFYARNLDEITAVFSPGLSVTTPFLLSGRIDSKNSSLELESELPGISYNQIAMRNISVGISPFEEQLTSEIRFKELQLKNGLSLYNLAFLMDAAEDRVNSRLIWNSTENPSFSGKVVAAMCIHEADSTGLPAFSIHLEPSRIIIADTVWQISPASVDIKGKRIAVSDFSFRNNFQEIAADGVISPDEKEKMNLYFRRIDLFNLGSYFGKPTGIRGMINGNLTISDFYDSRRLDSDLSLSGFEFREQQIGDITLASKWDREARLIKGELKISKNGQIRTFAEGFFKPENQEIDFTFDFNNQSLGILSAVIQETLTNFHGDGTGRIRVHGNTGKILMDGAVMCTNAGLTIDFTQVSYLLSDSIRFSGDRLLFRNIGIRDFMGNTGTLNGFIRHDNFKNMDYNLAVRSPKILALNTTMRHNERFYGKAIVLGNIAITGHGNDVKLSGSATSLPETALTIVLGDDAEVARYDFVRFVEAVKDTVVKPVPAGREQEGGLVIDLIINATPDARLQMVYNTQISDMIRAQGEGTLRFEMDKQGNIYLSGNYVLEEGDYHFTVQNVINKRFSVEPGGSVAWSGSPYDAVLELNAVYKLKASLYELLVGSIENVNASLRVPVECIIKLSGELINPDIDFDIEFPDLENRLRDEMQQFFSTQEDLNRQMLSLLVLGKFYTPEYVRGSYETSTSSLIGNTASDLFSNQLSNWLSQIYKDLDIGFNYHPGNQITGDEIELALSTQIFNDRVSINGNIGNNPNPRTMNNSELVGDFEINVKLTRNGKLQLKAYNKSNNNLIYETAPYTQGLGVSYKENYNHIEELWRNFLALFGKK